MQIRTARRGALVVLAAAAVSLAGVLPAAAAKVTDGHGSPHAYGAAADVTLLSQDIKVGPLSETYLPGGPKHASIASAPGGAGSLIKADLISSRVSLDAQGNSAEADIAQLKLLNNIVTGPLVSAKLIKTTCKAEINGNQPKTHATFAQLKINGMPFNGPTGYNQSVVDIKGPTGGNIAKLLINEKYINKNGETVVNGLHLEALNTPGLKNVLSGDVILAHSHCGPAAASIPMASGAGLYTGLGLLAAIAIPVGFVAFRRRSAGASAV
ncbi:MAG: choice-of-anchor P family protein [Sciscionella sp.]